MKLTLKVNNYCPIFARFFHLYQHLSDIFYVGVYDPCPKENMANGACYAQVLDDHLCTVGPGMKI